MNKKVKKKLVLRSDTIRKLDPQSLRSVAGGASEVATCDIHDCRWVTFTK